MLTVRPERGPEGPTFKDCRSPHTRALSLKMTPPASALLAAGFALTAMPVLADVPPPQDVAFNGTLKIAVDATDVAHRVFRVNETIPVKPAR